MSNVTEFRGRLLPVVAAETARYWLRRHRVLLLGLAAVTLALAWSAQGAQGTQGAQGERGTQLLSMLVFFAPLVAGLLTMSGIVADERESGIMLLWYQKPGTLFRYYLVRYSLHYLMLAAFALGLGLLTAAVGTALGVVQPDRAARIPLVTLSLASVSAAMVFAFSAWGVRRDSTVALLAIIGSVTVASLFAFDQGLTRDALMAVAFPVDAIQNISGRATATGDLVRALAHVLAQFAAWTSLAVLGLAWTQRALQRNG
jgi:hypothetical protein